MRAWRDWQPAAAALALVLRPAWVAAAEHGEHPAAGVGDLLFPAVNFAIFLGIFAVYVVPAMREYLRQRREQIVTTVSEATAALAGAEQKRAEAKTRLAGIEAEGEAIRRDQVEAAQRQAERLRAEAEKTGKRRLADAALVAEQERRQALASLRAEVAAAAAAAAERRIKALLGPADQRAFVDQFLTDATNR
jgi:F-type H+-transporting ATPase subunit b